jgi:hypothetical protein
VLRTRVVLQCPLRQGLSTRSGTIRDIRRMKCQPVPYRPLQSLERGEGHCRGVGRVLGDGLAFRLSSGVGEQQQHQQR